jgi:hypothetical protein
VNPVLLVEPPASLRRSARRRIRGGPRKGGRPSRSAHHRRWTTRGSPYPYPYPISGACFVVHGTVVRRVPGAGTSTYRPPIWKGWASVTALRARWASTPPAARALGTTTRAGRQLALSGAYAGDRSAR